MEKERVSSNKDLQTIIDLIKQLNDGYTGEIQMPGGLSENYQSRIIELVNKLNQHPGVHGDDISKNLIKALTENENRFKSLFENVPMGIHEIDSGGKIISMNPAGLAMLGFKKLTDVLGKRYLEFVDDKNKEKVRKLLNKAFKGEKCAFEFTSNQKQKSIVFNAVFLPVNIPASFDDTKTEVSRIIGIVNDITDDVLTKQALQRSKEDLKIVIDNIDEIIYAIDFTNSDPKTGEVSYLSPRVKKVLGYNVKEFVDDPDLWISIMHPDDVNEVTEKIKRLFSKKISVTRSYRLLHKKTKKYIWFEDKVTPKLNEKGDICGLIGGARDVTERKQTEQALADSEEMHRTFFEKAPVGIGLADQNGNLIAFNDAILKPGKYTRRDAQSIKKVEHFYYDKKSRKSILKDLKKNGFVDQKEVLFKRKDGSPYFASMSLTPLILDGKPYTMALVQDITKAKETEEALKESEKRNKTIVENVQEAILIFESGKKKFIDFNKNAIDLFGYSEKELKNMTPAQISPEFQPDGKSSKEAADEKISLALKGKPQIFEWVHRNKGGREFPCEIHLTSIPYSDRLVVMGSVVDISERKKVELERENLIKELDRFVYSASHDLSAPLKSILGLLNVTRLESKEPQIQTYLDKIEHSINKLEDFIREIIHYSRNSRLDIRMEKIDLDSLVKEILDDLKFTDGHSNIDFNLNFKELPVIHTDRFRLKVVLNNLLSNSIKFRKKVHNVKSFIKVTGHLQGENKIIKVIDNGEGIKKEYLAKIFDMFYRGTHSTSGSGLGLYIAKEAARNINGTLSVESVYGKGSAFTLKIS